LLDDIPTVKKKKQKLKRKWEVTPNKHNSSSDTATFPLKPKNCQAKILQNCNKAYMKSVTHLHEWKFSILLKK